MSEEAVPALDVPAVNVPAVHVPAVHVPANTPQLISKVFIGGYALIFGWLFIHTILAFWDLLIPWNITLFQHFRYYGAFTVYILLLGFSSWYYWKIWSDPDWSVSDATRWPLNISNNMALAFLKYSNMSDEPFPVIGSGWLIDDLRYPAFMSQPYSFLLLGLFLNDAAFCFSCNDENGKSTFLFRLWRSFTEKEKWTGWKENFKGILALAYIYFGYWFLLFVPAYALVRGYYSYKEWLAYGTRLVFLMKLFYCLSHLVIFAGWYSEQSSKLGEWTWPFLKDLNFIAKEEAEAEEAVTSDPKED